MESMDTFTPSRTLETHPPDHPERAHDAGERETDASREIRVLREEEGTSEGPGAGLLGLLHNLCERIGELFRHIFGQEDPPEDPKARDLALARYNMQAEQAEVLQRIRTTARRVGSEAGGGLRDLDEVSARTGNRQSQPNADRMLDELGPPARALLPRVEARVAQAGTGSDGHRPEWTGPTRREGTQAEGGPVEVPVGNGRTLQFGEHANAGAVTDYTRGVLSDLMGKAGESDATVTSTTRDAEDQARAMYANLEAPGGVARQKGVYGSAGDEVIDVYAEHKARGESPAQIQAAMAAKVEELGPTSVSRHAGDPTVRNVIDISPNSIENRPAFEAAVRADPRVERFLHPGVGDPAYHIEIPQPPGTQLPAETSIPSEARGTALVRGEAGGEARDGIREAHDERVETAMLRLERLTGRLEAIMALTADGALDPRGREGAPGGSEGRPAVYEQQLEQMERETARLKYVGAMWEEIQDLRQELHGLRDAPREERDAAPGGEAGDRPEGQEFREGDRYREPVVGEWQPRSGDEQPGHVYGSGNGRYVVLEDTIREGGTRAWRNNNPGNITYGEFARSQGAIGTDGRFAIFPEASAGFEAIISLLKTDGYRNLSMKDAMNRYAPPSENDTNAYVASIRRHTGIDPETIVASLSDTQFRRFAEAIQEFEGWKAGQVYSRPAPGGGKSSL